MVSPINIPTKKRKEVKMKFTMKTKRKKKKIQNPSIDVDYQLLDLDSLGNASCVHNYFDMTVGLYNDAPLADREKIEKRLL